MASKQNGKWVQSIVILNENSQKMLCPYPSYDPHTHPNKKLYLKVTDLD